MSLWYRFLYGMGITPWEGDPVAGAAAAQIATLFEREEQGREPPYGPALDLGCGSGIWSVALANRGWLVTGVDIVPKAIRRARARAAAAGVEARTRFLQGDVAALREAGVEAGFRFVLDFECFNHLTDAQRRDVGREVAALTAPGATMLLLVWSPARRGPLPHGAGRDDLDAAFPQWRIAHEDPYEARAALPAWLRNADLRFYRLRREPA